MEEMKKTLEDHGKGIDDTGIEKIIRNFRWRITKWRNRELRNR